MNPTGAGVSGWRLATPKPRESGTEWWIDEHLQRVRKAYLHPSSGALLKEVLCD